MSAILRAAETGLAVAVETQIERPPALSESEAAALA
jgi:hypothetical protein